MPPPPPGYIPPPPGAPPQPPGGGYGGYSAPPPNHPQAVTALVLGIVGLTICQICGPIAWVIGRRTVREIDASGGQYGGRGLAQAGFITGIIATAILVLVIVVFLLATFGIILQARRLG